MIKKILRSDVPVPHLSHLIGWKVDSSPSVHLDTLYRVCHNGTYTPNQKWMYDAQMLQWHMYFFTRDAIKTKQRIVIIWPVVIVFEEQLVALLRDFITCVHYFTSCALHIASTRPSKESSFHSFCSATSFEYASRTRSRRYSSCWSVTLRLFIGVLD